MNNTITIGHLDCHPDCLLSAVMSIYCTYSVICMPCIRTNIPSSLPSKWCTWCPGPEEILLSEDAPFSCGSYWEIIELCSAGEVIAIGHLQELHELLGAVAWTLMLLYWCDNRCRLQWICEDVWIINLCTDLIMHFFLNKAVKWHCYLYYWIIWLPQSFCRNYKVKMNPHSVCYA